MPHLQPKTKTEVMKINKKYLWIRIATFPLKLLFSIIWHSLMGIRLSIQWLVCGAQEVYYGKDHGGNLVKIIEQNEKIIERLTIKENPPRTPNTPQP